MPVLSRINATDNADKLITPLHVKYATLVYSADVVIGGG